MNKHTKGASLINSMGVSLINKCGAPLSFKSNPIKFPDYIYPERKLTVRERKRRWLLYRSFNLKGIHVCVTTGYSEHANVCTEFCKEHHPEIYRICRLITIEEEDAK